MPAGSLRSALEDFTQGVGVGGSRVHGGARSPFADISSSISATPLPGLSRQVRAASFLDTDIAVRPRKSHTAFVWGWPSASKEETETQIEVDRELERQESNDQEAMISVEKKVDAKLHELQESTERKLDHFFKTMREAYGVPFGVPAVGGARPATAGSSPGGADLQPWEGAKVKVRLPDLPPGKHATIQLERQAPVTAGDEVAGSQQEALATLLKRLDTLMRKTAGQPPADSAEKEQLRTEPPTERGSLGDLYRKLEMVKDNLSGNGGGPTKDNQDQPETEEMS